MSKLLLLCGMALLFGGVFAHDDPFDDGPALTPEDCLLLEVTIDTHYNQGNEVLANQYLAIYDNGGCMDVPVELY